jgi:hypothetical protein
VIKLFSKSSVPNFKETSKFRLTFCPSDDNFCYKEARNTGIKNNSKEPFGLLLSCILAFLIIRKPGIQEIKESFRVKVRMPVWVIDNRLRLNIFRQTT